MKKIILLAALNSLMLLPQAHALETPLVLINEQYGQAGVPMEIRSGHTVEVKNQSGKEMTYFFAVQICAFNHECKNYGWQQRLANNQSYRKELGMELGALFNRKGDKDIWASTTIRGEKSKTVELHSRARIS